jgi:hypothetical protein
MGTDKPMDLIGLNGEPHDLPVVCFRSLLHDLLQAVTHWANQRLPVVLGTAGDVIHDLMETGMFNEPPRVKCPLSQKRARVAAGTPHGRARLV